MARITRKAHFAAAHAFWLAGADPAENARRFGLAARRHGHNYALEVAVDGPIDPHTGMVMNLRDLKAILREEALTPLDFCDLNTDIPALAGRLPSLETLSDMLWQAFHRRIAGEHGLALAWIHLWESEDLFVERHHTAPANVTLSRRYDFSASHRLYNPALSEADNTRIFGKCANPNGHGHNYELTVSLQGTPDAETGLLCDLSALDAAVETTVLRWVDHKDLNRDVPFLAGVIPTAENLAVAFWRQLAPQIPAPARLARIRLLETRNNFAEYAGEAEPGTGPCGG